MKKQNTYLKNVKRIEFVITHACNSQCRHCQWVHHSDGEFLHQKQAEDAIRSMVTQYDIDSVLVFGGEPLLFPDTTAAIFQAAQAAGIPDRRLMTNGGVWDLPAEIEQHADQLLSSGVNSILLSVDTFHMEFIPLRRQHLFAKIIQSKGFSQLYINPVWVLSSSNHNIFNSETRECLKVFSDLELPICDGSIIAPEGNARRYLEKFYEKGSFDKEFKCGDAPHTQKLDSPDRISIDPLGNVSICTIRIGNLYQNNILDILETYNPYQNDTTSVLLAGGVGALQRYMESLGFAIDMTDYYSPCEFCREMQSLQKSLPTKNVK